jgi:hypothetical protein
MVNEGSYADVAIGFGGGSGERYFVRGGGERLQLQHVEYGGCLRSLDGYMVNKGSYADGAKRVVGGSGERHFVRGGWGR